MRSFLTSFITAASFILPWGAGQARAQTPEPAAQARQPGTVALEPRAAAGVHYTALALDTPDQTRSGLGGWFTYDVTEWVALDTNLSFYPSDDEITGRQWQGLIGTRAGWQNDRFGVFGKVRPGWVHFSRQFIAPETACPLAGPAIHPPPEHCLINPTNFALDVGGVVDFYPTPSTVLRLDVGNRMIRFNRQELSPVWTSNFQIDVAAGWRF